MVSVSIVQRYIPAYRVDFFEQLRDELRANGIELRVIAGLPVGPQATRGDAALPPWLVRAQGRTVSIKGRRIYWTSVRHAWQDSAAVIVPHQGTSPDAWSALTSPPKGLRVGVWGHIGQYVGPHHWLDARAERWMARRAHHVFAYTSRGGEVASTLGVAAEHLTVVQNTLNTDALVGAIAGLNDADVEDFRRSLGIPEASPLLAMVGGLDRSKRIEFVAEVLDVLHARGSTIHLLVAGDGDQGKLLDAAVARGQVTRLGYISGEQKALAFMASRGIVAPGRVGLLAVEALATRRPVLTTDWPYHAPEYEYLSEGVSVYVSRNNSESFATLLAEHSQDQALPAAPFPTLADMVANYAAGVRKLLA